jgi:hypothetical protein
MPTTIDSAGITFNDTTSLTSAVLAANSVGATQITNGSVTAVKLGTTEQKQICKAWVNFDGTLATPITPRAQYNVSSVTKNGTGDYTVNFATPMADANYSVSAAASNLGSTITAATRIGIFSTSNFTVYSTGFDTTKTDFNAVCIQIFGN